MQKLQSLITYPFSQLVGTLTGALAKHCYQNAWEVLCSLPSGFAIHSYVEGWLVLEVPQEVWVVEHGWNTLIDGQIVDSTLPFLVGPEHPVAYFSGVTYTRTHACALRGSLLPLVHTVLVPVL